MYRSTIHHKIAFETNEYSFILVTILKMTAVCTGPLKQNQRLASRPQADAVAKSLCKGGSWASMFDISGVPAGRKSLILLMWGCDFRQNVGTEILIVLLHLALLSADFHGVDRGTRFAGAMFLRIVRAAGGQGVKHEYVRLVEAGRERRLFQPRGCLQR
jgi:hypothetical protein